MIMVRRRFLETSLLSGAAAAQGQTTTPAPETEAGGTGSTSYQPVVTIERRRSGKPRQGQVVVAIQPHCDDVPIFVDCVLTGAGTCACADFDGSGMADGADVLPFATKLINSGGCP